jgi:hypothetical protein
VPTFVTPVPEDTHYGIPVMHIGEDGDMLALGHHEPRRALAAFNRHARVFCGLANVADDRSAKASDFLNDISQRWGQFRKPIPADAEDPDCEWYLDPCAPDAPNATPYMRIRIA